MASIFGKMFGGGGRMSDRCRQDPETGRVICERVRVNEDGTESKVAGFTVNIDANCNIYPEETFDNEEGNLAELEKKFMPKINARCKNKPSEF
jgi:hypothetical protein